MKRLFIIGIVVLLSVNANAQSATTSERSWARTACASRMWFEDMNAFVLAADYESKEIYMETNKCIELPGGVPVTIIRGNDTYSEPVVIFVNGQRLYTGGGSLVPQPGIKSTCEK